MSTRPPRLLAVLACLVLALLPQPASSARPDGIALAGDERSGPQAWRVSGAYAPNSVRWDDVERRHWARVAIDHVGATNDWMRDQREVEEGVYPFEPDALESRRLFARALFRAFGDGLEPDPA